MRIWCWCGGQKKKVPVKCSSMEELAFQFFHIQQRKWRDPNALYFHGGDCKTALERSDFGGITPSGGEWCCNGTVVVDLHGGDLSGVARFASLGSLLTQDHIYRFSGTRWVWMVRYIPLALVSTPFVVGFVDFVDELCGCVDTPIRPFWVVD